jgi:hypothetical protein
MLNFTTKKKVGEEVYNSFEKKISRKTFDEATESMRLTQASELAKEMPLVTMPLRENGVIPKGRNTAYLHVYQPNLWAQDFAYTVDGLNKMTVATAVERANAATEYKLEKSKSINMMLRKVGKRPEDLLDGMQKAALIESAYVSRLSGEQMDETAARNIDIALMKRAIKNESMLTTITRHLGVDKNDPIAILQISRTLDLTGCLQEIVHTDPYISEKSVKLASLKSDDFALELVTRLMKKKKADTWLIKAVEDALNGNGGSTLGKLFT